MSRQMFFTAPRVRAHLPGAGRARGMALLVVLMFTIALTVVAAFPVFSPLIAQMQQFSSQQGQHIFGLGR